MSVARGTASPSTPTARPDLPSWYTPGVGGITLQTSSGAKIAITVTDIEIDNGMGAKITLQGPQVSVNNGAPEVL
jgi:hypothetical protein